MTKFSFPLAALTALLISMTACIALADNTPFHLEAGDAKPLLPAQKNTFHVALRGKGGVQITPNELKEMHTQKFHMLIVSETLTDYIHVHPVYDDKTKDFIVSFTPKENVTYKAWADVTFAKTGKQEFLPLSITGMDPCKDACVDKTENLTASTAGITAKLALSDPLRAGGMTMADFSLTDADGKAVTDLEPVMGAYAHLVGFTGDLNHVLHAHPMGEEPTSEEDRGGPKLSFHIETEQAGYTKFYLQIRRSGKDIYFPFGLTVPEESTGDSTPQELMDAFDKFDVINIRPEDIE